MDLLPLRLITIFIAYFVYDPRSCSANEGSQVLYTKKTLALYKKLKQEPDTFLDILNITVAETDLKPPSVNSSNDVKVMLFDQGYLKLRSKPEKPGGLCQLELPRNSEMWLYANLLKAAEGENRVVADAISKVKSIFGQMPPEIDDFKCLILALETILNRIPDLIKGWQIAAMFGIFHRCELNVTFGGSPVDHRIIHCNDLPNNTCMRFVMDFDYDNAIRGWDDYYGDHLLPGLLEVSTKNVLAVVASFFPYKHDNVVIRDWYGQFESPTPRQPIREYRP